LAEIPNTPKPDVPVGADEHGNVERSRFGEPRNLETAKQHFELGEAMGLMDFEAAAKLSGSRFVVLRGQMARLERALGQFMIDLHTTEHDYTEVAPPLLMRDEVMFGTAQLPKFADDQFAALKQVAAQEHWLQTARTLASRVRAGLVQDNDEAFERLYDELPTTEKFWLIPTAEVPLTNLVRESIIAEDELPLRVTALTPVLPRRRLARPGRDTRGMLRSTSSPNASSSRSPRRSSREEHERMLGCAEKVLQKLDLPYRVMTLCTGDIGFASAKTYDIEVWLPGQGAYREISSCSVLHRFPGARMEARYRGKDGKVRGLVHTLNGSGVAVGRALIAVLENHQNEDGSVTVPSALLPYMGGVTRIEPRA
jgi:seryl-tRNA synthetase